MRKLLVVLAVGLLSLMAFSQVAFAGEYSPGKDGDRNRYRNGSAGIIFFSFYLFSRVVVWK